MTLYGSLRQYLRVNIIPALERCTIVATSLRGYAQYHEGSKKFQVESIYFTDLIATLGCIQVLVHEAVRILGQEEQGFRAFSRWLRHQIDLAAAEPGSTSALEMAEREAMSIDFAKVIAFIEGPLVRSRLEPIMSMDAKVADPSGPTTTKLVETQLINALRTVKTDEQLSPANQTLNLYGWVNQFSHQGKLARDRIQKWQDSTWFPPRNIGLETLPASDVLELRMIRAVRFQCSIKTDSKLIYQNRTRAPYVLYY